jgi:transcriptional regulator with XRE-family HTH domain
MMNTNSKMFRKLKDPEYRRLFIAGQIKHGFSTQLRALRTKRDMTQKELAELAETTQTVISRIENNGAANLSVQSLLKIAYAFDVALVVRLEPIDKLINWVGGLSSEVMTPRPSQEILDEIEHKALSGEAIKEKRRTSARSAIFLDGVDKVPVINRAVKTEQMPRPRQIEFPFKAIKELPQITLKGKAGTGYSAHKLPTENTTSEQSKAA